MIKANELRIGNIVSGYNGFKYVDCKINMSNIMNYQAHEPIPLTEEWLIKFGFQNCEWEHPTNSNGLYWSEEQKTLHFYDQRDSNYSFSIPCEFVHQFQNAFALTGEELTIK